MTLVLYAWCLLMAYCAVATVFLWIYTMASDEPKDLFVKRGPLLVLHATGFLRALHAWIELLGVT